ncbi:MAG: hypothetical protein FJX53_11500 [Alphaproteobacteria bacterium]|nr:hypothetical protein [Alphaproteobacteria bacterium]
MQAEATTFERCAAAAREVQCLRPQADGAIDGLDEQPGETSHFGLLQRRQPIGQQHRRRQDAALVVVDLADRLAQRCEPRVR